MEKKKAPYYRIALKYKRIVKESDVATQFELNHNQLMWLPKKHYRLGSEKVVIPLWLLFRKYRDGEFGRNAKNRKFAV